MSLEEKQLSTEEEDSNDSITYTERVNFRVSEEALSRYRAAARAKGLKLYDWARRVCDEASE